MASDQQGQKVTLAAAIDSSISRLWIDTFGLRPCRSAFITFLLTAVTTDAAA